MTALLGHREAKNGGENPEQRLGIERDLIDPFTRKLEPFDGMAVNWLVI